MKLNLLAPLPPAQKAAQVLKDAGFESPVGWWKVTTEGDCEGRSTRQLGEHYGHVAEIAFSLAHECAYQLEFRKVTGKTIPETRPTYQATRDSVWVAFEYNSPFYHGAATAPVAKLAAWLDTEGAVEVREKSQHAAYYNGYYLVFKG